MGKLDITLTTMARTAAEAHGLVLVCARLMSGKRQTLEVLLENADGTSPLLDTCAAVSKQLARALDETDPIKGRYTLEVGSAGLTRPLLSPADYKRFSGRHARLSFGAPQMVRDLLVGAVSGTLSKPTDTDVTVVMDGHAETFPYSVIRSAELSPTKLELAAFTKSVSKPTAN